MSFRCINAALDGSLSRGPARLVLLVLANYADNDGRCYPGLKALAEKCGMGTTRSVLSALATLRESGEVTVFSNAGAHKQNKYLIAVDALEKRAAARAQAKVKESALVKESSPVKEAALVKKSEEGGEETFMHPVQESSPKPSENHQEQPSVDGTLAAKMSTVTGPTPSASAPAPADLDAWLDECEQPPFDGTNLDAIDYGAPVKLADGFTVPSSWQADAAAEYAFDGQTIATLAEQFPAHCISGDGGGARCNVNAWYSRWMQLAERASEGVTA